MRRRAGGAQLHRATLSLTAAERRVLSLVAEFKSSREIAEVLRISYRTVQNHRVNMCTKLSLKGSKALLRFALDHANELEAASLD